ncbi:hypothetical protein FRB97_005071 [Tulasnella sp. 331]|nr:hypothetical protein FRB97_005071 [Tulasnella sp. 331]KAG8882691.1 hypothetical protein FRB98_003520 [Tulasnella sp. 332]
MIFTATLSTIATLNLYFTGALAAFDSVSQVAANNVVYINSATDYCMIVPSTPATNIGDSERPGGEQTFCTNPYDPSLQGTFPSDFFQAGKAAYVAGSGVNGQPFVQLTGCINVGSIDRLNAADFGGQYDSNGGEGGMGNPQGSACLGFQFYVELMEPAANRACLKCCDDPADCPVTMDTDGCQAVIPGNYFDCNS